MKENRVAEVAQFSGKFSYKGYVNILYGKQGHFTPLLKYGKEKSWLRVADWGAQVAHWMASATGFTFLLMWSGGAAGPSWEEERIEGRADGRFMHMKGKRSVVS